MGKAKKIGIAGIACVVIVVTVAYSSYYHLTDAKYSGLNDRQIAIVNNLERVCHRLFPDDPQKCEDDAAQMTASLRQMNP